MPASSSGLTSLLTPNTNLRFVNALNTEGGKISGTGLPASGIQSQSVRLMSPTKTITLQQAQQLGLISPKKVASQPFFKSNNLVLIFYESGATFNCK